MRRKTVRGAPITIPGMAARGIAGSQRSSSAWLPCAGLVGTVHPVHTHPRHRVDAQDAKTNYGFPNSSGTWRYSPRSFAPHMLNAELLRSQF